MKSMNSHKKKIEHKWLNPPKKVPVIVGMGRLTYQKDFKTLIKAVSLVNRKVEARLLILGEGELKKTAGKSMYGTKY